MRFFFLCCFRTGNIFVMADKGTHELRAFLDGIEGFDSIRAAECLSRLVDAGYDTIGVLKLAKKRDLIKDAGLKPGYALPIVSAAQKAVAPSHSTELGAMSKHGDSAETQPAQEQGPSARTKPHGKGSVVIERHHESSESGGSPSLKSQVERVMGEQEGKKKRKKRAKNWTDEETNILLQVVSQKTKSKSCINESPETETWWDGIAKDVLDRTRSECRRRNETLVKSYNAIKKYCDKQNKEFKQLNKEDFRNMKDAEQKPATRLLERWYNHIGYRCSPRSNKKMRNQGAGGSLGNGVDFVSSAATSRNESSLILVLFCSG
jgi:hypothetical protein